MLTPERLVPGTWVRNASTDTVTFLHTSGAIGRVVRRNSNRNITIAYEADTMTAAWRELAPSGVTHMTSALTRDMDASHLELYTPEAWRLERIAEQEASTMRIGDWVEVRDGADYRYTGAGAIGQVHRAIGQHEVLVNFEPDTLSIHWRHDSPILCNFDVCIADLQKLDPDNHPWVVVRRAELLERELELVALQAQVAAAARRTDLQRNASKRLSARMQQGNTPYPTRSTRHTYNNRSEWAEDIRGIVDGHRNLEETCDILNGLPTSVATRVYRMLAEKTTEADEIFKCNDCGEYCRREDSGFDHNNNEICCGCLSDYNYSERMGCYVHPEHACSVYASFHSYNRGDPDDYCTTRWGRGSDLVEYGDDVFLEADVYDELESEESDDDVDDDDDSDSGLHGYHSSSRYFTEINRTPNIPALGVELEVYADDRYDAVHSIKQEMSDECWYYERDGSLDSRHGFEIITQPYGPEEWPGLAKRALANLIESGAVAYTQPHASDKYGIHVNVSRGHLTGLQEARMLMFTYLEGNRDFLQAVAQRRYIYGGEATQLGAFKSEQLTISRLGGTFSTNYNEAGTPTRKKVCGRGKYNPINLHDGLAEFRMFQSTLHYPSFMKNLEFVWALIEWTSTKAATGTSVQHADFVLWLGANPAREAQYPHLIAFLRKPSFMGKNYTSSIRNTWKHLLPQQTTKSLGVVSGDVDLRLAA